MIIYIPQSNVEEFRELIERLADNKLPNYLIYDILEQVNEQMPKNQKRVDIEGLVEKYVKLYMEKHK